MGDDTILITGATGKTGRRVSALLRGRGLPVRDASRTSATPFDWDDPATWPAAVDGVRSVYVVHPDLYAARTAERLLAFGRLAVQAGAARAVMVSVPRGEDAGSAAVVHAEQQLVDAGLGLTVLRLRWFAQNLTEDFLADAVARGDLRLPAGDGAEAFVDADDIAEVAVAALTDDSHAGREYDLTGPRTLTFGDVADEITAAIGRTVSYTPLSAPAYIAEQIADGVPEEWARFSAGLYAQIASGALDSTSTDIADVLGRPARDFREFAAAAASEGRLQ